ncbi:MAG TPA: hypothetical protein EYN06_11065 [Myxococcales bacterium]|nr:hypothetical protein [Myxococcales bacterium]
MSLPADTDGDGRVDAIESAVLDTDADCLMDQFDSDDTKQSSDMTLLVAIHCKLIGVCAEGTTTFDCVDGVPICNYEHSAYESSESACDALDNDCDGLVDEALAWKDSETGSMVTLGGVCHGIGNCGLGQVECASDKTVTCSTNANGSESEAIAEKCDGLDNDCDGQADEDLRLGGPDGPALGALCEGGGSVSYGHC